MKWHGNRPNSRHRLATSPIDFHKSTPVGGPQRHSSLLVRAVRAPCGVPLWHEGDEDERARADDADTMQDETPATRPPLTRAIAPFPSPIIIVTQASLIGGAPPLPLTSVIAPMNAPLGIIIAIPKAIRASILASTAANITTILPAAIAITAIVRTITVPPPSPVANGVVLLASTLGTSGGDNGSGGQDEMAAAATTSTIEDISTVTPPTKPRCPRFLDSSASWVMPIDNSDGATARLNDSSLLPMVISLMVNVSECGGGGLSGVALGVSRITAHILPPPTAVGSSSARRSNGRPTASAKNHLAATPPRPAPAGLLPSSLQPQQGRVTHWGSRVGRSLRANQRAANRQSTADARRSSEGAAKVIAVVTQE